MVYFEYLFGRLLFYFEFLFEYLLFYFEFLFEYLKLSNIIIIQDHQLPVSLLLIRKNPVNILFTGLNMRHRGFEPRTT